LFFSFNLSCIVFFFIIFFNVFTLFNLTLKLGICYCPLIFLKIFLTFNVSFPRDWTSWFLHV
jgi:hypothetical protein